MEVAIIGAGYVGLVTAAALAHIGHTVTCVDVDTEKIRLLETGGTPIFEPNLPEVLRDNRSRLRFTTDTPTAVAGSQVVIIAVGTPSNPDGSANLTYLEAALADIGRGLATSSNFKVIVNKSTVPLGTTVRMAARLRELAPSSSFGVASNPEFLRQGSAVRDSLYPDRIVVGSHDQQVFSVLEELYGPLLRQEFQPPEGTARPPGLVRVPLLKMDPNSAELAKYAANAFLAMKISFINEIANVAERVGADVGHVADVLAADPRIGGQHLKAGIGYGGSCFPKDTRALYQMAGDSGYEFKLLRAVIEVNNEQWRWVPKKLVEELGDLQGKRIALLGVAFKPGTDDLREAPSLLIAEALREMGAGVVVYDPVAGLKAQANLPALQVAGDSYEALRGADAAVIVTEWEEFGKLDWNRVQEVMQFPLILDGRRMLQDHPYDTGLRVLCLGRCSQSGFLFGAEDETITSGRS